MSVRIEPWAPGDRERVLALVLDIQQNEFGVPITAADQPDLSDVAAHYRDRGGFWVAREGNAIVGTIGLLDHGDGTALRKMFVRADRRGREWGVASRLFDGLLAHARARDVRCIRLGTRPEMTVAHRFYEKRGFVRIDPTELPASFPRMHVDSVFYRLDLA